MNIKWLQQGGNFRNPLLNDYSSVVDFLKAHNTSADMNYRKKLADMYGISDYKGTSAQNIKLLEALNNDANAGTYYYQDISSHPKYKKQSVQEEIPQKQMITFQGLEVPRLNIETGQVERYRPTITSNSPQLWTVPAFKERPVKKVSFKDAFADAYKKGLPEFVWNGSKYNTNLKQQDPVELQEVTIQGDPQAYRKYVTNYMNSLTFQSPEFAQYRDKKEKAYQILDRFTPVMSDEDILAFKWRFDLDMTPEEKLQHEIRRKNAYDKLYRR